MIMLPILVVVLAFGASLTEAQYEDSYHGVNCSSVKIVSRQAWGARAPKGTTNLTLPVDKIFLHHTAMAPCFTQSDCIQMVRSIQNFHMDSRGWFDLGYNYLIGQDGYAYEGRGWDHMGAQVLHWNRDSFGISVMGNFMNVTPNAAALHTVKGLIACATEKGKLRQETFTVHGHRDGGRTACPGDQYYELIQDWPNYGGSLHPSTEPTPFHPSTEPTPSGSDVARRPSCIAVALVVLMSCAASMRVA